MGIYLKGMKMPVGVTKVEIGCDANGYPMAMVGEDIYDVIPIPPHGDLIDRNDLKYKPITIDYDEWNDTFDDGLLFVCDLIDKAPAIIPAEVNND